VRFSLQWMLLFVAAICATLASYRAGRSAGRRIGYDEARDHFHVMMFEWAKHPQNWTHLGELLHDGECHIIGEQLATEAEHRRYLEINRFAVERKTP
jgi:hypothetical protein